MAYKASKIFDFYCFNKSSSTQNHNIWGDVYASSWCPCLHLTLTLQIFWFVDLNEIHIWKRLTILDLLVVWGISELGWNQTRLGLAVPQSVVVPLSWSLTLLLTEKSLHLKLSRLLLVKVINSVWGFEKIGHEKKLWSYSNGVLLQEQTREDLKKNHMVIYQMIAKVMMNNYVFSAFWKKVRVVVEDIGYRHENVEFGFRIKQELLEDEKEMLKNT